LDEKQMLAKVEEYKAHKVESKNGLGSPHRHHETEDDEEQAKLRLDKNFDTEMETDADELAGKSSSSGYRYRHSLPFGQEPGVLQAPPRERHLEAIALAEGSPLRGTKSHP